MSLALATKPEDVVKAALRLGGAAPSAYVLLR
jgi:hypothetical protein